MKKRTVSLLFVVLLLIMSSCAKKPIEKDKWKGDNMEDFIAEGLNVSDKGAGKYPRVPYEERLVGLAYTTWFQTGIWQTDVWAYPTLGKYKSDDKRDNT